MPPGNRTPMHVTQHELLNVNKDLKTALSDYFFKHFWASLLMYMCDFPLLVILILNMAYICGFNYILQLINGVEYVLSLLKGLYNVIVYERDRLNRIAFPSMNSVSDTVQPSLSPSANLTDSLKEQSYYKPSVNRTEVLNPSQVDSKSHRMAKTDEFFNLRGASLIKILTLLNIDLII